MIADLLQIPLRDQTVYDELSMDGLRPRVHWEAFVAALQRIPSDELLQRWLRAERRIHENGVTYNMYSDPKGASRPWRLDLVPLLIPPHEWQLIEQAVIQRAELLNLILQDLYGPQSLLYSGAIPPELVFANPAFLRPLSGTTLPGNSYLHLVGVDMARSPDGQWWVIADRTQAPSGAGYALENRTIVSDALPELFEGSHVRHLDAFIRAWRAALIRLAGKDSPRIVLLTPGHFNETYFEHSFLARHLGFTLVEGGDLTVRDRCVYVKTVEGLQQVDVIVRRVDDSFCDPLELRSDSLLGVPGLVDVVAAGNVRIANALGSGLVETPAIMPFLPGLARQILGETLRLPSVATWWCGQRHELDWALAHLDQVVIKSAFSARAMEPVFGAEVGRSERAALIGKMKAKPFDFVAQERIALSVAPVWDHTHMYSRSLMFRTYALNTGDGWRVFPGGLVRVAGDGGNVVSMQRGGHSKDAWVLSDTPDGAVPYRRSIPRVQLLPAITDVPSRVADNLFWLGRYVERSENIARLLRTLLSRVRRSDLTELQCLLRLHKCFDTKHSTFAPKKAVKGKEDAENEIPEEEDPVKTAKAREEQAKEEEARLKTVTARQLEAELLNLMSDQHRSDSLASTLGDVHRTSGKVRERLSTDMMRLIGQLPDCIQVEEYMLFVEYGAVLTGCLELLSAFSGMERENLTRGAGWLFLTLGRRLERALYSARLLTEVASSLGPDDWPLLEYLLEVADSSITYRNRYYTALQPIPVLDVLMMDETNPRSLDFQLSHLADLYQRLPRHMPDDARAIRHAVALLRSFELTTINDSMTTGSVPAAPNDERERLQRFLKDLDTLLPSWSDNLSNTYFSHARTLPINIG